MRKKNNIFINIITFRWLLMLPVMFYKKCLSPIMPSVCVFYPSCSHYMMESIQRHGVKGLGFGIWRLLRCHPLAKGGFDPVPVRKKDYKNLY